MLPLGELTLSNYKVRSLTGTEMMPQGEMTW